MMSSTSSPSNAPVQIHIDGASRGNPGPAACGIVVESAKGELLKELAHTFGKTTNNVAEYRALLAALEYAVEAGYPDVALYSDSQLLTRQILGEYKVKKPDLIPLHRRAKELIARFESFSITHVPREENREADRLANQVLDGGAVSSLPLTSKDRAKNQTKSGAKNRAASVRFRAEVRRGSLHPLEAVEFKEGEEVEVEIRRRARDSKPT